MSDADLSAPMGAAGRRRSATGSRRPGPLVALAVVVPLLTAGAIALAGEPLPGVSSQPPRTVALDRATLICPGTGPITVANADPARAGEVVVGNAEPSTLQRGALLRRTPPRAQRPVVIGRGVEVAPGLLAVRDSAGRGAASSLECRAVESSSWFTGVGAGPEHNSVLHLSNPDAGVAVADVTVMGADGEITVDALRGVAVPARSTVAYDLGELTPTVQVLGVGVQTTRGRLGAWIDDRVQDLGSRRSAQRLLWGQREPSQTAYLMGVAQPRRGDRTSLAVSNPGDDAAVVQIAVVTKRSEFVPNGQQPVRVPAGATIEVPLTDVLAGAAGQGVIGLKVRSTVAVVSSVSQQLSGALLRVSAQPAVTTSALVLPQALTGRRAAELVIGGADRAGTVRVTWRDADGKELTGEAIDLRPGAGAAIEIPARARVLMVTAERATVFGAVRGLGDQGARRAWGLSLTPLLQTGAAPQIRPALN